ncbi:MAG TPA: glycosyltransferase family 4 protein [Ignavibacteria bacterium]|nr:glycosyltransferase family 4 protein [Ignavibacteria bacterium]
MPDNLPILFYQPSYPGFKTGGELFQNKLFSYFKSRRTDVFVTGDNDDNLDVKNKIAAGFGIFGEISSGGVLVCTNNECVHFYFPLILRKLFFRKVKVFLIVHHLIQSLSGNNILNRLESAFIRKADYVITISSATKNELVNRGIKGKETAIVYPGIDIKPVDLQRKHNQILFTGKIEERKGIHILILALAKIKNFKYKLIIAGEYDDYDDYFISLKELISELNLENNIIFTGRVSDEELVALYSQSGIFVFPSQMEGYGLSLIEAMKCGIAVIASDIPSSKEIISDGVDGLLFEKNNSDKLSEKIDLLLQDAGLQKRLSENAIKRSEKFNSWDDTCSKVYELFSEAMK